MGMVPSVREPLSCQTDDLLQRWNIHALLDSVRQSFELVISSCAKASPAWRESLASAPGDLRKERGPKAVVLEDAMQGGPHHGTGVRHTTLVLGARVVVKLDPSGSRLPALHAAVMNLVPVQ